MAFSFAELVEQFLTSRRAFAFETDSLIALKHDGDLVPGFRERLEAIAEAYGYFTAITHETQGINDNGSDVSVKYRELDADQGGETRILGFQLKSHKELKDDKALQIIKAQRDDAFRKIAGLAHYYIVLCGSERVLRKRLNAIRAEFLPAERTTVVSPTQALRFLRYSTTQIDAQVKLLLDRDDAVLRRMREELDLPTDTAKAFVCHLVSARMFDGAQSPAIPIALDGTLGQLYDQVIAWAEGEAQRWAEARDFEEMLDDLGDEIDEFSDALPVATVVTADATKNELFALDLAYLDNRMLEQSSDGGSVILRHDAVKGLLAVAADAVARFDFAQDSLTAYLIDLSGVDLPTH